MPTPGLGITVDPTFLSSTELKNAFAILAHLPLEKFNNIKRILNLTIPNVLGPTTLSTFLRFCINSGIDLSSEGVRIFKEEQGLDPNKPILEVTAGTYYKVLGFEEDDNVCPWMEFAKGELAAGVREFPGDPDNPRIVEYHKSTTMELPPERADEIPWCSSFVNWCMMKADIKRTKSPAARSWLNWGDKLTAPKYGCVVILWRESPSSWKGHVGLFLASQGDDLILLGGNQGNAVTKAMYSKEKVLGYRWPKPEDRLEIDVINPD